MTEVSEKVVKRGGQWCVIHCHGPEAGQAIKCFDTEAEAQAMHRAIQARKHEAYQHPDFHRIRTQFIKHVCGDGECEEGVARYNAWIKALNLDETKSYLTNAGLREKFQWVQKHADFKLWKEDATAKYWRVEAGFPLKSMNENVYSQDELMRAARTIKGKTVNVNHKFMLSTVEILGGEFEDDVVECVIRVPNSLHCPMCDNTKTINDLIESKGIVNVSLEAACDYGTGPHGECEGMHFTGLSLLTKDVLPGIPLTRLMPLESIMVEALQSSTTEKPKVKKVKMEIVEASVKEQDDRPPKDWWDTCISKASGFASDPEKFCGWLWHNGPENLKQGFSEAQLSEAKKLFEQEPSAEPPKPKGVLPDEHGQCPEGMIFNSEIGLCVKDTSCPEGQHFDENTQKCVPDKEEDSVNPETKKGTSPAPEALQLELSYEKRQRIDAQTTALKKEKQVATLEEELQKSDKQLHELQGKCMEQAKTIERLEKQIDGYNVKKVEDEVQLKDTHHRIEDLTISRDDYKQQLEKLKVTHEELTQKYHMTLSTNLELSRKLTGANEDYLKLAQRKDEVEEALKKTRVFSKKILRIKA